MLHLNVAGRESCDTEMKFHRRHNMNHSRRGGVCSGEPNVSSVLDVTYTVSQRWPLGLQDTKRLGADVHHMYIYEGHMQLKLAQSNDIISTTIDGKNGEPRQMQETKERKEVEEGGWTVVTCATVGKKTH
uniref:Uncharacterized protein n=1 Tax=Tanacetum cinerariifolium TaxID=118510 RepID=A0A6L2MCX9_TANCI|nr:hypothetical protein [Tanacetum cinerariifolium]